MTNQACEMSLAELDAVNGGDVTIVAEKGYVGIEVSIGGYGVAVWATGGSVCGSVTTPTHKGGTCT